jgi:DNA invertase Pin-like site-specific DNA recombinase
MQSALCGLRNQMENEMTFEQVKALLNEAEQAGDRRTVLDCNDILNGNEDYAAFQRVKTFLESAAS